jgi:hypothetical protein
VCIPSGLTHGCGDDAEVITVGNTSQCEREDDLMPTSVFLYNSSGRRRALMQTYCHVSPGNFVETHGSSSFKVGHLMVVANLPREGVMLRITGGLHCVSLLDI